MNTLSESARRENDRGGPIKQEATGVGVISLGLTLVAVFSVLALGGRYSLAIFLMQITVSALGVFTLWRFGWPAVPRPALALLALLLAVPLVQMVPLWEGIVAAVSPARAAIVRDVLSPVAGPSRLVTLTVNAHATRQATLQLICYILVFLLAFHVCTHRRRQPALVAVLIGVGCFEAAYGIIQYLTGWRYNFISARWYPAFDAAGTYTNRDHFAGLLEMVLPFVLAGILFRILAAGSSGRPGWMRVVASSMTSRSLTDIVLLVIVCLGLIFSRSRMGMAAALVGVLVVLVIALLQTRRPSTLALILFILALPATYAIWIGLTPVIQRFKPLTVAGGLELSRLTIWRDTLALIRDYPLLGTGLGTYRWASLHYQSDMFNKIYEHAHNDYLEFAADMGVPAAVLLFGALWILVAKLARRAVILERTRDKILAAGCAAAMASLLTHSFADFNLQIPANAFLFAWIAGTGAALVRAAPQAQERA